MEGVVPYPTLSFTTGDSSGRISGTTSNSGLNRTLVGGDVVTKMLVCYGRIIPSLTGLEVRNDGSRALMD